MSTDENLKKPPLKLALMVGGAMFLGMFLNDAIGGFNNLSREIEPALWSSFLQPIILFSGLFILIRLHGEQNLNGYSTYGRALGACTIGVFFLSFFSGVYQYLYYSENPEAMDSMVNYTVEQMKNWISDEDKLEEISERLHEGKSAVKYGLNALVGYFIFGFVISLIVAAFQKFIIRNYKQADIFSK